MNKNTIPLIIALCTGTWVSAQEVIAGSGRTSIAGNLIVSQTVGETVTASLSNSTTLCQGFHQGDLIITSIDGPLPTLNASIHPNPFVQQVNINTEETVTWIDVIDASGATVRTYPTGTSSGQRTIDLNDVVAGQYLLRLYLDGRKAPATYRLTKQ